MIIDVFTPGPNLGVGGTIGMVLTRTGATLTYALEYEAFGTEQTDPETGAPTGIFEWSGTLEFKLTLPPPERSDFTENLVDRPTFLNGSFTGIALDTLHTGVADGNTGSSLTNFKLMFLGSRVSFVGTSSREFVFGDASAEGFFTGVGNDAVSAGGGDDYIDGGAGNDVLEGGTGNDTYVVDAAGDRVIEAAGAGVDRVFAFASHTLADNVEALSLRGAANITGAGNALANQIVGNVGNNTLSGNGGDDVINGFLGADTMIGGAGNDTFFVDNAGDRVGESTNGGFDTVFTSVRFALTTVVEQLFAIGSADIALSGNSLANTVAGNAGDNFIDGGAGADTLTGGVGNDVFVFRSAPTGAVDWIIDFSNVAGTNNDRIALDNAIFAGIGATGALNPAIFKVLGIAGAAADANDRVFYNASTGVLAYDADGPGLGVQTVIAQVIGAPTLTAADFIVI
jgi:Ca2+-binding RTX toxin-like protein